jgi:hypothetical protein
MNPPQRGSAQTYIVGVEKQHANGCANLPPGPLKGEEIQ